MRTIHRNGVEYREWCSIADQYVTPALDRSAMARHLRRNGGSVDEVDARLHRADANGTSQVNDTRSTTEWDTERCDGCAGFHHAYAPRAGEPLICRACGEPERDRQHRPPCKPPRKAVA